MADDVISRWEAAKLTHRSAPVYVAGDALASELAEARELVVHLRADCQMWHEYGTVEQAARIADLRSSIEAARKLAEAWPVQAGEYPINVEGAYAGAAVRCCARELLDVLQDSTGSAGTGAGNHPGAAPSGSAIAKPAQPVDSLPGVVDAAVARVAAACRRVAAQMCEQRPESLMLAEELESTASSKE